MNKEIVFVEERKRSKKRIEITETDLMMMIVIEKVGFCSIETFVNFADLKSRTVQGRFTKLMEFGYLTREREGLYFPYQYFLTQKGMNFVFEHFYLSWMVSDEDYTRKAPRRAIKNARHQNLVAGLILLIISNHPLKTPLNALECVLSERDTQFVRFWEKSGRIIKPIHHNWLVDPVLFNEPLNDVLYVEDDLVVGFEIELTYKGRERTDEKIGLHFLKDLSVWFVPDNKKALISYLHNSGFRSFQTEKMVFEMKEDDLKTVFLEFLPKMNDQREIKRQKRVEKELINEKKTALYNWFDKMERMLFCLKAQDINPLKKQMIEDIEQQKTVNPKERFEELIKNRLKQLDQDIQYHRERINNSKGSLFNRELKEQHKRTLENAKFEIEVCKNEIKNLNSIVLEDIEI